MERTLVRLYFFISVIISFAVVPFANIGCKTNTPTYPNADRLVSAQWVKEQLIDANNNGKPYVIVEASWGGPEDSYDLGHIPGAIHVNTDEIEYDEFLRRSDFSEDEYIGRSTTVEEDAAKGLTPDDELPRNYWNLYPDQYLLPAFAYMGIDIDTTVVVYGADPTAAARVVWALIYAGVKDVRMLDGGYHAWLAAGYEGTTEPTARNHLNDFGTSKALNPKYVVDTDYVRKVVMGEHPDAMIVDIRSYDEYIGKIAPYSYIPTDGRIKGAVWGYAGETPWTMEHYLNPDGTLKPLSAIETMWNKAGITRDKTLSFYCGTGWRASLAWFCAYMMGWENINLYDGGWYEWSMGPDAENNPVEDDEPNLP